MTFPLKAKLSAAFALVTICVVAFIFFYAHYALDSNFQRYLLHRQDTRIAEVKRSAEESYAASGAWESRSIEPIGISALEQGLILVLRDASGGVVWDAAEHNSGMCADMLEDMAANMRREYPDVDGGYTTQNIALYAESGRTGELEIGYYGPFYLTSDESLFIGAVDGALLFGTVLSLLLSLAAGILLAWRIASPIAKVAAVSREIAKGDYNARGDEGDSTTEIRSLIRAVNELAYVLSEQRRLRKRLTQDIEHELKTPMYALQCNVEAMIDGVYDPSPERLRGCLDEITRINGMIGGLNALAKSEDNSLEIERGEFDMGEMLASVCAGFEGAFADKGVALTCGNARFRVSTDGGKLARILVNLLSNSLKYTPEGGRVAVNARDGADRFEVTVADNGCGISAKDMPLIFERFYRTDESRARGTGGAGIGLAIVRALATALGGTVSVESEPGVRTVFTVSIAK
ncbi:MAG: HAMP domain-containing histidine kinase [Clostridiales Family XIII bacterium]|nr:HAMP domain-containing histidine kinase [Clostridiales Family XIII bacterium]